MARRSPADATALANHSRCARVMTRVAQRVQSLYLQKPAGWEERIDDLLFRQDHVCAPTLLYRECTNAMAFVEAAQHWCRKREKRRAVKDCLADVEARARTACKDWSRYLRSRALPKRHKGAKIVKTRREKREECRVAQSLAAAGRAACDQQGDANVLALFTCKHGWTAYKNRKCKDFPQPTPAPVVPFDVKRFWKVLYERQRARVAELSRELPVHAQVDDDHAFLARAKCEQAKARKAKQLNECKDNQRCERRLARHVKEECARYRAIMNSRRTTFSARDRIKRVPCTALLTKQAEIRALCANSTSCTQLYDVRAQFCHSKVGLRQLHHCRVVSVRSTKECQGNMSCPEVQTACLGWVQNRCAHVRSWMDQCTMDDNAAGCQATFTAQLASFGCA